MKLLKPFVVCIYGSILFQYGICDDIGESPAMRLTCICALGPSSRTSCLAGSPFSSSCNCTTGKPPNNEQEGWTCSCASAVLPEISNVQVENCFSSCNCTSGSAIASGITKKLHISSKILVVLLLLVVLATIGISGLFACYFYHKDRSFPNKVSFSSDKSTSWNSASNLLSQQTGLSPTYHVNKLSGLKIFTGFVNKTSCFFKSTGILPGTITRFSYLELENATNKFSDANLLGIGGSSKVYRGLMIDGRLVAIKRLNSLLGSHADYEFLSEIEIMSRLHHRYVVPLLGYCLELRGKYVERLLVFEYLPKGNLRECLDASHEGEILEWKTRVSIALGIAKGLEYLHEAVIPNILHRDIKSTNILLDEECRPKITDLGMAKRLSTDDHKSCASSPARMMGTFGYFAPEYAILGRASLQSDVFSFGVVLLELITGRKPIHKSLKKGEESLVLWAMPHLHDNILMKSELPDPLLKGNFLEEEMRVMTHLARECLEWDPESRPSMSEVVQILRTISPDKPKHRNFGLQLLSDSQQGIRGSLDVEENEISNCPTSIVEIDEARLGLQHQHTCVSGVHLLSCLQQNNDAAMSQQNMEKLVLLTSHPQRSQAYEDEAMDLTEPHLESFMLKQFA